MRYISWSSSRSESLFTSPKKLPIKNMFGNFFKIYIPGIVSLLFSLQSAASFDSKSCLSPNIIERAQWGARSPASLNYLVTPLLYAVIHHTVTPECNRFSECADIVRSIQNHHMNDLGWDDIGYSFMVGGDGNVYEGTGWSTEGAHTLGYNRKSIGIAFIGNFQQSYRNSSLEITVAKDAKEKSLQAAHDLIICGKNLGYLRSNVKVIGARQVSATESPGNKLYAHIQSWPEWSVVPRRENIFP
ncbi:peptidoglycan-recognition protein 1-like [Phymastichus coffea]|uniref:peptidoglycan-recognition protein 1-like n=1 Tax=Phymastichus coffea TaxID=108790 RepID=UPI00273CB8A5|nr:peptidoglycan-recognition protein 1-like [Phymastichus coffea]